MDISCLPLVVYLEIFTKNFNLEEKLKLRLVCKQWRQLIDLFGQESLAIWEDPSVPYQVKWPDSGKPIDLKLEILNLAKFRVTEITDDFDRIDISSVFFQNLQRLCLYKADELYGTKNKGKRRYEALLNSLNQLQKLSTPYFYLSAFDSLTLTLRNLKVLCLKRFCFTRLVLQTPNLKKFVFWSEDEPLSEKEWDNYIKGDDVIEFIYPESIESVECQVLRLLGTQNFPNLKTLICWRVVTPFDLKKFPHLKELSIYPTKEELPILDKLKEQRDALGREDSLSILVYGCEYLESELPLQMIRGHLPVNMTKNWGYHLDADYEICYYRLEDKEMYKELVRWYPRMVGIPMPWHFVVDYPNLVDAFNGCVPANFLDKFTEINMVIVTRQMANEPRLFDFVRRSGPKRLVLKNIRLHRNFYCELRTVQSIEWLTLDDDLRWTKSSFLSRLRNLRGVWVEISQKFPLDFILRTYSENESLVMFYLNKPNFGRAWILKMPKKTKFYLSLKYPNDNNETFSDSFNLDFPGKLAGIQELKHFVGSQ